MGQVRNDFGELRVVPTLDYSGIAPGQVLTVADEDVYHWVAGGWTALTKYPVPPLLYPNHRADPLAYEASVEPAAAPAPAPEPAPAPVAAPADVVPAAPEGEVA